MINALYYTDFLYRPRRPEELDTAQGGGVGVEPGRAPGRHRAAAGRRARATSVRALTGAGMRRARPRARTAALLTFDDGAFASLTLQRLRHFDSDEFCDWIGELGMRKSAGNHGAARRALRAAPDAAAEVALKNARNYGGSAYRSAAITDPATQAHQHFGTFLVSCEGGDLRPMPHGVMVYDDAGARLEPLPPPAVPRVEVIDELERAIASGVPALHDGRWARATLEVCVALLESARTGVEVALHQQVSVR